MRRKYEFYPDDNRHLWSVADERGGMHFWVIDKPVDPIGGIEIHYHTPPEYMQDSKPCEENCWLLNGPCWHDGSSLWAHEYWIPKLYRNQNSHEWIFEELKEEMDNRFGRRDCSTCHSITGCDNARSGGPEGYPCWTCNREGGQ